MYCIHLLRNLYILVLVTDNILLIWGSLVAQFDDRRLLILEIDTVIETHWKAKLGYQQAFSFKLN